MNKYLLNFLKFGFAIALIYWLSTSGKIDWSTLIKFWNWQALLFFMILTLLNLLINNYRWQILLRAISLDPGFWACMKLSLVGIFFNYAMPGGVGGDIVKAYYLAKTNKSMRSYIVGTVLLDRIIGFAAMALMALTSLLIQYSLLKEDWKLQSLFLILLAVSTAYIVLVGLSMAKITKSNSKFYFYLQKLDFKSVLSKLLNAFEQIADSPKVFWQGILLSFVSQSCLIAVVYFSAVWMLGFPLDLSVVYFAVPLGMMAMAAPIAPAGIGVGQMAMYGFFEYMKVTDPGVGSLGITVIQILLFVWGLLGCFFYLRMGTGPKLETQDA